jgi:hypothetical protein
MPVDKASLKSSEAVQRWFASRALFWRSRSRPVNRAGEDEKLLETLAQFCEFVGKDPDTLINECLEPAKEGQGLLMRMRQRRQVVEEIERFEAKTDSREEANVVRSFFIHNGVAMNPGILP